MKVFLNWALLLAVIVLLVLFYNVPSLWVAIIILLYVIGSLIAGFVAFLLSLSFWLQ